MVVRISSVTVMKFVLEHDLLCFDKKLIALASVDL